MTATKNTTHRDTVTPFDDDVREPADADSQAARQAERLWSWPPPSL